VSSTTTSRKASGIAFIAGQLGVGGAEQQLYYLLSGLDRLRFQPLVISLGPSPHEYWERAIAKLDIPVAYIPRRCGPVIRVRDIAAVLAPRNIRIVHSWVFHTNGYAALAGRLARAAVRVGSMREDYYGLPNDRFLRWIGCRGLDAMVTNSANNARQLQLLGLTRAAVHVVPNGVPVRESISLIERNRLKAELGFQATDVLVGSVGRLDPNKNHVMLLRVFARLTERWPALRLVILGDGPLRTRLVAMTEALGIGSKVVLPGAVPLAARYLPALEVCCLTSYSEGMPNLIMEAAAAGVPVVSTRCGDSVQLIEDGISGFIVSVDDDASMAAHIDRLLTHADDRSRIGEKGRDKMRRQFSVPSMIERMSEVYEVSLVSKGVG
jgi:glycosyltransferase involved in cell wall biosynthesis